MSKVLDVEQVKVEVTIVRHEEPGSVVPQFIAGFLATLSLLSAGITFGWPASALIQLESEDAELRVTSSQGAWVVSALFMGACFGPLLSTILVGRIGRKWTIYAIGFPYIVSWLLIYCAWSFECLLVARFIAGIAVGANYSTVPVYVSEISENKVRGALGTMTSILVTSGSLIAYALGPYVTIKFFAGASLIPCVIFLLTFAWMPDTPYYHISRKNVEAAEKSLKWLRGKTSVEHELKEMSNLLQEEGKHRGSVMEMITLPGNRKATLITLLLLSAQQFTGIGALLAYLGLIIEKSKLSVDTKFAIIFTGCVMMLCNVITLFIVDTLGRKPLLMFSSIGTALCLWFMGVYFDMEAADASLVENINWIPLAAILLFYVFFSLGLGPVPYAVLSEIYPTNVKAKAVMVFSIYGSVFGVFVTKSYQVVADKWGEHVILYSFAFTEFCLALLIIFIVPETKGKSFKEIQDHLKKTKGSSRETCDVRL